MSSDPWSASWPEPRIAPGAWVADSAVVIGDVRLAAGASLWPTAVARGDVCPIVVGEGSNVQDGAVLHGDPGQAVTIGSDVTIGHRAVVHGATLEDGCLIGIGAIVLNGVTVGTGAGGRGVGGDPRRPRRGPGDGGTGPGETGTQRRSPGGAAPARPPLPAAGHCPRWSRCRCQSPGPTGKRMTTNPGPEGPQPGRTP
jgi:hypothetical protein